VLEVNAPVGNIFANREFENIEDGNYERLQVSRIELEKRILRKKTDCGTDVGLKLNPGVRLRHGDIIRGKDPKIIIEQLPEKVISMRLKPGNPTEINVLLGHMIGNMHKPISIQNEDILIPIQSEAEKDIFIKIFHSIVNYIEIKIDERLFLPQSGTEGHHH